MPNDSNSKVSTTSSFNEEYDRILIEAKKLRLGYIQTRFSYLERYCAKTTGQPYSPENLSAVLVGLESNPPGTSRDPWENFKDRPKHISEAEIRSFLFNSPRAGVRPKKVFVSEFNEYLTQKGVLVRLEDYGVKLKWRAA